MQVVRSTRSRERGSAILIVFLFAAVLAISLYMEMPSVAFEAKRAKEQLLVDRGDEYAHAVKLYYRKYRSYPANLDALENTNRLRFLRHRFKDPMTGEDKWRLLHAGPGGVLTDSKVNPIGLNANASNTNGSNTNSSSANSSNTNAANTNGFGTTVGSNSGTTSQPGTVVNAAAPGIDPQTGVAVASAGLPQRPPEMPVNAGQPATAATGTSADGLQLPPVPDPTSAQPGAVQPVQAPFGARGAMGLRPGMSTPPQLAAQAAQAGQAAQLGGGGGLNNPMQGVQGLMTNPNPPAGQGTPATAAPGAATTTATTQTSTGMGVIKSGGIAGVASLASGASIKAINDQQDYSLWEFYYDPSKDTSGVAASSGMNAVNGTPQSPGAVNLNGNSNASPNNTFAGATTGTTPPNASATPSQPQ